MARLGHEMDVTSDWIGWAYCDHRACEATSWVNR